MDVSGISFLPHIVLRYLYMLDSLTVYMVRKGRDSTSFLILCSFLPKIKDLLQEKEISRRSKPNNKNPDFGGIYESSLSTVDVAFEWKWSRSQKSIDGTHERSQKHALGKDGAYVN
ncbi:hypothetical protein L2E82_05665 [Cichorium intybus]|uniref:Uncharacterized protein n=1 Tax=Cichorium intybus TaxID=13427 RepID=A0ACB9HA31_CICIN|nr:hypothetical protein L2E82_05665 [Cichorium intybus]